MKKALLILLAVVLATTLALGLAACSPCKKGSHNWNEDGAVVTTPATCEQEGEKTVSCWRCGETKTEPIPKSNHTPETVDGKPATCKDTGLTDGSKCSVCGETLTAQETIKLAEHTYGKIIAEVPATCLATGTKAHYECSVCHKLFVEANGAKTEVAANELVLPVADHNYGTLVAAVVPTDCTQSGKLAHYECSVCHKFFNEQKQEVTEESLTVAAGHKLGELQAAVAPGCETTGTKAHYQCSVCQKKFADAAATTEITDVVVPALGHTWKVATENIWTWANDYTSVNLHLVCATVGTHTTQVTLDDVNVGGDNQPTCTAGGTTIYSVAITKTALAALLTNGKLADDVAATLSTSTSVTGGALGHDYQGQVWVYDDNGGHHQACVRFDECGTYGTSQTCTPELTWDDDDHWTECTVCHDEKTTRTTHDIDDEVDFDDDGHWYVCHETGCGAHVLADVHTMTDFASDNTHHWNVCTGCEHADEDNKVAHDDIVWIIDEETHIGQCQTCDGDIEGDHETVTHPAVSSTSCETTGTVEYDECEICGAIFVEDELICDDDGTFDPDDLSDGIYGDHELTHVAAVQETCTLPGKVDHWHCSVCGKNFQEQAAQNEIQGSVDISATGHSYVGKNWEHAATDGVGVHHMDCANCTEGKVTANCAVSTTVANKCDVCDTTYTPEQIVEALYNLASGASLNGTYELTGVVTAIVTAYDSGYGNVTVDITVAGQTVRVFRVKNGSASNDVSEIDVGATITVRGILKNYNGIREFDAGCTLEAMTRETFTVEVQVDPEGEATAIDTTTGLELGTRFEAGTTITFRVRVNDAAVYAVSKVEVVGGSELTPNGSTYSLKIVGHTIIKITLGDASSATPAEDPHFTLTAATLGFDSSGYAKNDGDHTVTAGEYSAIINTKDAYLKPGTDSTDIQGRKNSMVIKNTAAFPGRITKIVIVYSAGGLTMKFGATSDTINKDAGTITSGTAIVPTEDYYFFELKANNTETAYIASITIYFEEPCTHDWRVDTSVGEDGWTWNTTGEVSATLAFKCSICQDTTTETATISHADEYTDCTSNGTRTYTATVDFAGGPYTDDSYSHDIDPKGHNDSLELRGENDSEGHYHWCPDFGGHMVESEKQSHSYTTYTNNNEGKHTANCTECNYLFEQNHTWNAKPTRVSDEEHETRCSATGCNATQNRTGHEYNIDGENGKECACGQEETHEHKFTSGIYMPIPGNPTQHAQKCTDDDELDVEHPVNCSRAWELTTGGTQHHEVCTDCGREWTTAANHAETTAQIDGNSSEHNVVCETCHITLSTAPHREKVQQNAGDSVNHSLVCEDCGYLLDGEVAHTPKAEQIADDDDNHRVVCDDCGYEISATVAHVFLASLDGVADVSKYYDELDDADYHTATCTLCGAEVMHESKFVKVNGYDHKLTCEVDGCHVEITNTVDAHDYSGDDEACTVCGAKKSPAVWEQAAPSTKFKVGDRIVISYGAVGMGAHNNSNYREKVDNGVTTADGKVTVADGVVVILLEKGYVDGTFAMRIDGTTNYLYWTSGNNVYQGTANNSKQYAWTITPHAQDSKNPDNNRFDITNQNDTTRVLQYNNSTPRFACYTGTQQPVNIYVLTDGVVGYVCNHNWQPDTSVGDGGWTWNKTGTVSATLTLKCTKCDETDVKTATVTHNDVYNQDNCTADATRTYTATVTVEGQQPLTDEYVTTAPGKPHTEGNWYTDDPSDHWRVCSVCGSEMTETRTAHTYTTYQKVNDQQHKSTCSCGHEATTDHAWATTYTDLGDGTHAKLCEANGCDAKTAIAAHGYAEEEGSQCPDCTATKGHTHNFTDSTEYRPIPDNTTQHAKKCLTCNALDTDNAVACVGATWESVSDTQHHQLCVCGREMVAPASHTYLTSTAGITDLSKYYTVNLEAGTHSAFCTVCNYESTGHSNGYQAVDGESYHKIVCADGKCNVELSGTVQDHDYSTGTTTDTCKCGATKPQEVAPHYEKVTSATDIESGQQYLIVAVYSNANYAFEASTINNKVNGVQVTVTDNEIAYTTDLGAISVTLTNVSGTNYTIKLPDGKYLSYSTSTNCGSQTGTYNFSITIGADGLAHIVPSTGTTRELWMNSSKQYGMYATSNSGYYTPSLYKLVGDPNGNQGSTGGETTTHVCNDKCQTCTLCTTSCGEDACSKKCPYNGTHPSIPGGGEDNNPKTPKWVFVEDASTLQAGDKIVLVVDTTTRIIAGAISGTAFTEVTSGFKFSSDGKTIETLPDSALILILGGKSGAWTLANSTDTTKLLGQSSVSSNNKLQWGGSNTTWKIEVDNVNNKVSYPVVMNAAGQSSQNIFLGRYSGNGMIFSNHKASSGSAEFAKVYKYVEE